MLQPFNLGLWKPPPRARWKMLYTFSFVLFIESVPLLGYSCDFLTTVTYFLVFLMTLARDSSSSLQKYPLLD